MNTEQNFCCKEFAEHAGHLTELAGGGGMYPVSMRPDAQFEPNEDGSWRVNGCCGGGCAVVSEMKFCPFCGSSLADVSDDPSKARLDVMVTINPVKGEMQQARANLYEGYTFFDGAGEYMTIALP